MKQSSNKEASSFGAGYPAGVTPIDFPKKSSLNTWGKKKPFVKAHGGDQYGVTMHKSDPAVDFPTTY